MTNSLWTKGPLYITLLYAVVGILWVLASDWVVHALFNDAQILTSVQNFKGFGFVVLTACLLYGLIRLLLRRQTQFIELLKTSEIAYKTLFETNPNAQIIVSRENHRVSDANLASEKLWGLKKATLVGQDFVSLFSKQDQQRIQTSLDGRHDINGSFEMLEDESPLILRKGDTEREVELSLSTFVYREKTAFIVTLVDATDRLSRFRELQHALQRLDIARQVSGMGCWEIDLDNKQIYCCRNVVDLLDLPAEPNESLALKTLENSEDLQHAATIFNAVSNRLPPVGAENETRFERSIETPQGQKRHLMVHAHYYEDEEGKSIVGTFIDLSPQKRIERKLLEREAQLINLLDILPDGVLIFKQLRILYANQAAANILNVSDPKSLNNRSVLDFVQEDSVAIATSTVRKVLSHQPYQEGFVSMRLLRSNNEAFDAEIAARQVPSQAGDQVQIVIRDLSDILRIQEDLKVANQRLAALSSKTLDILEKDRRHIAGELHDEVGQALTAMKLGLGWLRKRIDEQKLSKKLEDMQDIAGHTLDTVRNLSLMLRPAQLDNLGLAAAIQWQAEKLFADSGILLRVDTERFINNLDKNTEITAFRVVQESLTNVLRHSQASVVEVRLVSENDFLHLSIVDDGEGFDVDEERASLGLINMKERVEVSGGTFNIRSLFKTGTQIFVRLPVAPLNLQQAS